MVIIKVIQIVITITTITLFYVQSFIGSYIDNLYAALDCVASMDDDERKKFVTGMEQGRFYYGRMSELAYKALKQYSEGA